MSLRFDGKEKNKVEPIEDNKIDLLDARVGLKLGNAPVPLESESLFRGDTRIPNEIFNNGFRARGLNTNLFLHVFPPGQEVSGSFFEQSAYISTSSSKQTAAGFPYSIPPGTTRTYVYEVHLQNPPIDVAKEIISKNKALNPFELNLLEYEKERVVPFRIKSSEIRGGWQVKVSKVENLTSNELDLLLRSKESVQTTVNDYFRIMQDGFVPNPNYPPHVISRFWNVGRGAGRVLTGLGLYYDASSLYHEYQQSSQTGAYTNTYKEGTRIAGGWSGAYAGGAAGVKFGASFCAPLQPYGPAVCGLIGGFLGSIAGYRGGSRIATTVYDESKKSLGNFSFNIFSSAAAAELTSEETMAFQRMFSDRASEEAIQAREAKELADYKAAKELERSLNRPLILTAEPPVVDVVATDSSTKEGTSRPVYDEPIVTQSNGKTISPSEFKKLLAQQGMSADKITAIIKQANQPLHDQLNEIQLKQDKLETQKDYLLAFQGLDKFAQTIAKIGYKIQSKELVVFAGGLSSISEIGSGLSMLGYFSSGAAAEIGIGATVMGAASIFTGVVGLSFAVLNYCTKEEESDELGQALQVINQKLDEITTGINDIKNVLHSGFRQLSEMMLHLSKGLEHLSEQQRQTFELARRGFQAVQSTLQDMRAANRLFHKRILEDLDYLTYRVESKELSQHKQVMQECIDSIKFHLQEEKVDVRSVQENLFKLRSKINSLSTKEVNGAAEHSKLKDNPRQAATFLLRRLSMDDSALGFLAEEFESITGVNLAKKGVKKEKLFATGLWNESVNTYLQLALEPNCLPISDKSLDEITEQSENARKFMCEIGHSDILEKLFERHEKYLHELQLLILSRMDARRKSKDKEQKQVHSKAPVRKMLKDYFLEQDLEVLDNLLDKIDYNYVLINRFVDLGGFQNKEEIVNAIENRRDILKKLFNFYEAPTRTVNQYCDYLEPVALSYPIVGYNKPQYKYDNANMEIIGGNAIKIKGKEHLIFISTGIIAPGSHESFRSGRVEVTLSLYDVTSNKVSATFRNAAYPGHSQFLPVPVTYKFNPAQKANWAWGSGHTVTLSDGDSYFVLFTGGSGHVSMWNLTKQEPVECDNSTPFAFDVMLPIIEGGRRDMLLYSKSKFSMTSHTDVLFNRMLIVYKIDWQRTKKVALNFEAYDLEKRRKLEYGNLQGFEVDKQFLTTPNQMFFQTVNNWTTRSEVVWGALVPGKTISVMFASKNITRKDLSVDVSWTIHKTLEIPIEAKTINQVRCEIVNRRLFITASISTGNNANKLICIHGSLRNHRDELDQSFEYFELDLPEVCTVVNGQDIARPMIHSVADWQTMRTAVFEMGGRSYVIATLLDPTYTPLVFLIDPMNKQITRLADGPKIEFAPSGLQSHMRLGEGFDPYLSNSRKGSPGQFPVNGYSIHVSELDGMLTLYFSYANSNPVLGVPTSGSVQTTPYLLAPQIKSDLHPWFSVDCQRSDKETPDNELGQVLVNMQTLINSNKQNKSKKPSDTSAEAATDTLESKPFCSNKNQMDELKKLMDDDVWFMYHQLIEVFGNLQKTKILNPDLLHRLKKIEESINEFYKLLASNDMKVESVLNLLRDISSAFNILNVHFKRIDGHKHKFAKEVSVVVRKLDKFVDKIEKNIADQNSKLSVRTHSMFSPGRGFTPKAEIILRKILMTLGPPKTAEDKTKLQELNTLVATHGMKVKEIARDGDCFYSAVADHLKRIPKKIISSAKELQEILNKDKKFTHEKLREIAVDHILNNREFYQQFIPGDMNKFASDSVQKGIWAEDIMPHALARALNINLIVINSDGTTPIVIKRENAICTVSLGYEVGTHYNGLEVMEGNDTSGRYLRDLLDAAHTDDFGNKPSNLGVAKVA